MRTASSPVRHGLRVESLDTLFFRDGRPFDAAARAYGGLPLPQTFAGAIRTALLANDPEFDFPRFLKTMRTARNADVRTALADSGAAAWIINAQFRGPWLALRPEGSSDEIMPLLTVPQTLVRVDGKPGEWLRAEPRKSRPPGWPEDETLLPVWRNGSTEARYPGGFLTLRGVRAFLEGGVPDDHDWYEADALYGFDYRTGIGLDMETLTAADAQIYGVRMLALRPQVCLNGTERRKAGVCLYGEILTSGPAKKGADALIRGAIALGGEGRYASVALVPPVAWPSAGRADRALWLLATAGAFGAGNAKPAWRPDAIPSAQLRAAVSAGGTVVSGWDVARNEPRPSRFVVPAGAVYHVDGSLTLNDSSLCGDAEDAAQGWGFALKGVWNDV